METIARGCSEFGWDLKGAAAVDPSVGRRRLGVDKVIVCFSKDAFQRLSKAFGGGSTKAPAFDGSIEGRLAHGTALYLSSIGAAASAMMLEEMISSGIRRVLVIGYAGSISPSVRVGDIVVPTWGIREEGTSYHYFGPEHEAHPSRRLVVELERRIDQDEFYEGGVWTTDAVFRETRAKIARYAKMGVLAIDMECTALMCVAQYRKVELAAVLAISDELFGEKWVPAFKSRRLGKATEIACRSARDMFSTRRGA